MGDGREQTPADESKSERGFLANEQQTKIWNKDFKWGQRGKTWLIGTRVISWAHWGNTYISARNGKGADGGQTLREEDSKFNSRHSENQEENWGTWLQWCLWGWKMPKVEPPRCSDRGEEGLALKREHRRGETTGMSLRKEGRGDPQRQADRRDQTYCGKEAEGQTGRRVTRGRSVAQAQGGDSYTQQGSQCR